MLADGFYEWRKEGTKKVPMRIVLKSRDPFGFAGLWDEWTDRATGQPVRSCTIITTEPNDMMRSIHNRMPVIFPPDAQDKWMEPIQQDTSKLVSILSSFNSDLKEVHEVSKAVNSPKYDDLQCITPVS